jgi:hypothetical protein
MNALFPWALPAITELRLGDSDSVHSRHNRVDKFRESSAESVRYRFWRM